MAAYAAAGAGGAAHQTAARVELETASLAACR
jgi:hypothetical protein